MADNQNQTTDCRTTACDLWPTDDGCCMRGTNRQNTTKSGLPSRDEQITIMEDTPRRLEAIVRRWLDWPPFREAMRAGLPKHLKEEDHG